MICPECLGTGTTIYYCETDRDENSVTVKKFEDICHTCHGSGCKPQTNADRIRAMTDEELAEWIHNGISSDHCDYCEYNNGYCDGAPCHGKADAEIIAEWLKQPAREV